MNAGQAADGGRVSRSAFPKDHRLIKTDEFSSVFGFRKAVRSTHFLLHYRTRAAEEGGGARLGVVVAKRLLRRAVDRNLVKRLARESFRRIRSQLAPRDIVLRLAVKPESVDRRALAEELRRLLAKMM